MYSLSFFDLRILFTPLISSDSSNIKFVERCKLSIPNTQIHDLSHSWFGTCSSITCDDVAREFVLPLAYVIVFLSCQIINVLDYWLIFSLIYVLTWNKILAKHNYEVSLFRKNESMDQRNLGSLNSRTTEEYEDTKGVITIRVSKKDRQHNDRKSKQRSTKKYT